MSALTRHYAPILEVISSIRQYIFIGIGLFLVGSLLGFVFADRLLSLMDALAGVAEALEGQPAIGMAAIIFLNNAFAAAMAILLGPAFGVLPAYSAVMNGSLVGVVVAQDPASAWMILPHGVFELPAVFLAWGLGMWCGAAAFQKPRLPLIKERVKTSLRIYLLVILPLLVVAAIIEGIAIYQIMSQAESMGL